MTNGEAALQLVVGLEHLRMQSGIGGGVRRSPEDLIEDARKYQAYLDESEGVDDGYLSVFVLTSKTYMAETDYDDRSQIVGIYATQEAAVSYRDNAVPPVADGVITEWGVHDVIVGPDGQYLPIGAGE